MGESIVACGWLFPKYRFFTEYVVGTTRYSMIISKGHGNMEQNQWFADDVLVQYTM